jgi:HNH endonuclease
MARQYPPFAQRFWAKVARGTPDECWVWQGATGVQGFGHCRAADGRPGYAHRLAYEMTIGPIPPGLTIGHLCGVRACVNPAHLRAITFRDAVLRGRGIAARNAAKTHCVNGHPLAGDNLYVNPQGTRHCRACHRLLGRREQAARRAKGGLAARQARQAWALLLV